MVVLFTLRADCSLFTQKSVNSSHLLPFGTHGGEGGIGLSSVLALIQYYKIPLGHIVVTDEAAFNELAEEGKLSERMFLALKRAKPYDWKYYRVESIKATRRGKETFLEVDYWEFRTTSIPQDS